MTDFSEELVQQVWDKASPITGYDSSKYRKDVCGAWIIRSQYNKNINLYGWTIDMVIPLSEGGTYTADNLRPIQWQNGLSKVEGKLICLVRSTDNGNYELERAQMVTA
jgi:hypothetical protein